MNQERISDLANIFLALSDKTRLRLIDLMQNGEVSVGFLAESLGESQPKTSRHLAYLRNAGVVSTRRDGKFVYYFIERSVDRASENILLATLRSLAISDGEAPNAAGNVYEDLPLVRYEPQLGDISTETYTFEAEEEFPVYLL